VPLLFGHDAEVAQWVGSKMAGHFLQPHIAVGMLDSEGSLRGAFVLAYHTPTTAEMTVYSECVISNGMWKEFARYAFLGLGLYRMQIRTARSNKTVKKAAPKYGFKFEGVARDYFAPGDDALLFYMTPSTCRWIKNGQSIQVSEAARAS
jgi:hypothetical protein